MTLSNWRWLAVDCGQRWWSGTVARSLRFRRRMSTLPDRASTGGRLSHVFHVTLVWTSLFLLPSKSFTNVSPPWIPKPRIQSDTGLSPIPNEKHLGPSRNGHIGTKSPGPLISHESMLKVRPAAYPPAVIPPPLNFTFTTYLPHS
jgi:hypothetical protein